ncbi:MAG: RagB/SusD family nutrient uptake outer membrane protein [Sporocytophaga sp.]|nr:RagB/SusD family nutrient uptake outer membrane protein [Sporocytophaga sp.]
MFKKIYPFIGLIVISTLGGCKKDFLDKTPQAAVTDENYYKTASDLNSAINAAYDPMGWETERKGQIYANLFFFGDVVSDDAIKGGSGTSDIPDFHALETFIGNAGLPALLLPWQRNYTGIYRANLVIERAPLSNADEATKTRVINEAKFLRAYYHFEQVKMYGDVPLVTKVLGANDYNLGRTPAAEVYKQIEADLKDASALPQKGGIETGRATRGAALALLAKVQMYQTRTDLGKWNEVLTNAESVINSKIYDLEKKYADVHTVAKENGIESIFEIQSNTKVGGAAGDNNSDWSLGNEGTFINVMFRGRDNGGWGFNCPSLDLLEEFKKEKTVDGHDDPRLKATIIQDGDSVFNEKYKADINSYPYTGTYCRKYVEPQSLFGLNQSDGPSNYRIIRYADVLLMAAEAANELGMTEKALKYLKEVRDRVNMPEVTEVNKDRLREIIWRERRVELALEGHRFFDIVRQGRAAQIMGKTYTFSNAQEVFPVPQAEIDMSKGKIKQTTGLK